MNYFNLIPAIYLYNGKVVDKDTREIIGNGNPVSLATIYDNNGADELLIFDLSATDNEHEANISAIIQIADAVDIPMLVGGNIKRLEDVKKYIYAGAKKAILCSEMNMELLDEASARFGSENIALYSDEEIDKSVKEKISLIVSQNSAIKSDKDILYIGEQNINIFAKNGNAYGVSSIQFDKKFNFMNYKTELKAQNIPVNVFESPMKFSDFKTNEDDMIPVIVQDYKTDKVLMLAYMNEEAFNNTIATGKMTYYSRSRDELWVKGETSGHYQYVKELYMDCDVDTMLAKVRQTGVPCHTGADTCFFNELVDRKSVV